MSIEVLQEITDWGDLGIYNGIYYVNDKDQLIAYKGPDGKLKQFSKPMKRFSRSRRKFRKLETIDRLPEE